MSLNSQAADPEFKSNGDRRSRSRSRYSVFRDVPVTLLENISDTAVEIFEQADFENIIRSPNALQDRSLQEAMNHTRLLGIRSGTKVTAQVLQSADNLLAVGCFSVGTNQVDLLAAKNLGIPVFNAPFSNTRSVAELTIAEIVILCRGIFPKSNAAHRGEWLKSAKNAHEVRGKTLGIVGYGNIGTQVAVLAEALGMRVFYFDHTDKLQHGNVRSLPSLGELLAVSDFVSLHLPETERTRGIMGNAEFDMMKPGAFFINNARGSLVVLPALVHAIQSGKIMGAAVDVFPTEPGSISEEFNCALRGFDNVILTPHIAGSTHEAQDRIGSEVAKKLVGYMKSGSTIGAVNFPQLQLSERKEGGRLIQVQQNSMGELSKLNAVLEQHSLNVTGQFFETSGAIGYAVVDFEGEIANPDNLLRVIRDEAGTIRVRLIAH